MSIASIARRLRSTLYPATCAACDNFVAERSALCGLCLDSCEAIGNACPTCALPIGGPMPLRCARCMQRDLGLTSCTAAFEYGGQLRAALMRLKFSKRSDIASSLAPLLESSFAVAAARCDLAVPVPLHRTRLRKRGYNQCQRLLAPLARSQSLAVDKLALVRVRATDPQAKLDAKTRRGNLRDAFRANPVHLGGKRVLILDDIMTTGETMRSIARTLRRAGAREVHAFVVARAEFSGSC